MTKGNTAGRKASDYATKTQRLRILTRDDWTCQTCGTELQNENPRQPDYAQAGHIVAHHEGGDVSDTNLMAQCLACNSRDGGHAGGRKQGQQRQQLRQRVAELEAENERLRAIIRLTEH